MHSELFLIDSQGVLEYIALRSEQGETETTEKSKETSKRPTQIKPLPTKSK